MKSGFKIALFVLGLSLLIPIDYSYAAPRETILKLDSVSKFHHVGEIIYFSGKLVDSQKYMLAHEKISIHVSSPFSKVIGTGFTDARGNFMIKIPAELWNGDGKQSTFYATYAGSDKYLKSTSNSVSSEMRKLYTPLGKEFEYEKLEEEGYFKQKTAPANPVPEKTPQKIIEKSNPTPQDITNTITETTKKPQDFFSQLIQMFKSLFGFS